MKTRALADEQRDIILVACSKCDWKAAFPRADLIASHGADYPIITSNRSMKLAERVKLSDPLSFDQYMPAVACLRRQLEEAAAKS